MKQLILLSAIFFLGASVSFGQLIEEGRKTMSKGSNNSFSMDLIGANKKDVEKLWLKYAKEFGGKTKKDKKSGEYLTDDGKVSDISNNTMDVYTMIRQSGPNTQLSVWFDLGGAYLNSTDHPSKVPVAENVIMDFALKVSTFMLENEIKDEEKLLKNLQGDFTKLGKDKEKYEKDIEDAKALILQREADIEQNILDQEAKTLEIESQMGRLQAVQDKLSKIQ